jgi:cell division transport system permease protein
MSGSYDRPGPPGLPAGHPGPQGDLRPDPRYDTYEPYDEPVTGPPGRAAPRLAPPEPRTREDLQAPTRSSRSDRDQARSAIVPAGSVTGRSLTLVITIMCFLACLTAGAVYMMNQSASAWLRDIASEVTVQVEARDKGNSDSAVREIAAYLQRQPGIRNVRIMKLEESASLLEPWLGHSEALKTLPVPRLIALEVDRQSPPDFAQLRAALGKQFKGASLDDHRQWQQQIRMVTRSFALGGLAILFLVACATTAVIVSATRSALASNREIVEVLHFVGATDRFIAREFERHFLRLGIRAGLVGAISAMLVFFLMPSLMEVLGGGGIALFEMQRFIGSGSLDLSGYGLLVLVVVVIAALCMLTSRFWVYRTLHSQH